MQKLLYVSRILFASFRRKLALIWLIILLVSFGLSMSLGIVQSQLDTQSYYLNDDMRELAFLVDAETGYYTDISGRGASTQKAREQIRQWHGLRAIYEQTTVEAAGQGWMLFGYPSELLSRLHLPTAQKDAEMAPTTDANAIWLDHRLRSEYKIGESISLNLMTGEENTCEREFTIAGFLNEENVHYDFQFGSSAEVHSGDFVVKNPSYLVCIAVSDAAFAGDEFDGNRSCAKFLLPEEKEDIDDWKKIARRQGVGYVSSMEDILSNDQKNIDLMTTPILVLCCIMIILTLIGLIGTQLQLMNRYKQLAFSLAMSGMDWNSWKFSWLSIFCLPLLVSGLVGAALGNIWKNVILLEGIPRFSPIALAIGIAIVLLSALGILPTIGRWSRIDINEFRRLSE